MPAPRLTGRFSRTGAGLCGTSCVIRTAQVTGPFDPLPSSVPSREVHDRSAAGTSQVSQRPAELARHRAAGLSMAGRCILPPMRRPGSRGLLPGVVSPKRYPDINRVLATARGSRGPCVGQTLDPPVTFREPDGLFTEDGRPSRSRSKRCGEPLAPARFRPPYVRNHCYAGAHSGAP